MNDSDLEDIVSAALDGEAVDLCALRRALGSDEGRHLLASCVLIRATANAGDLEPGEEFRARLQQSVVRPRARWLLAGPRIPASLAASLVVIAIVATLVAGRPARKDTAAVERQRATAPASLAPPASATTTQVAPAVQVPGIAVGSAAQQPEHRATVPVLKLPDPPKPSRVLRFEDWRHGA